MRITDLRRLLPSMRIATEKLLETMKSEDMAPKVLESYRTPQRAAELAGKGTGISLSVHCYGAGVDICCDNHLYDCEKWGCPFMDVLGREGKRLGLVWGGDWKKRDYVHLQGCSVAEQGKLRQLGYGSDSQEKREALVRRSIASRAKKT